MAFVFWTGIVLIVYTYLGYFFLIKIMAKFSSKKTAMDDDYLPHVSLIISVYNEQDVIHQKIANCRALDYPSARFEILFGLDGTTDKTESLLSAENNGLIKVYSFEKRRGKAAVLNDLVAKASGEILVFSDANTMYEPDALQKLTRHFVDSNVGGVCGELVLQQEEGGDIGSSGEKIYWDYEKKLKYSEGNIRTVLGANGAIYAIRRDLYANLPLNKMIIDDFLIPLRVVEQGFRVIYDSEAVGTEYTASSIREEFSRKIRIGIGNFNALNEIGNLLNPARGFIALALWSHKIIRWFVPLLAVIVFIANILLAGKPIYNIALVTQLGFYLSVLVGALLNRMGFSKNYFSLLFYFFMVNLALLIGLYRVVFKSEKPTWTPTARSV